MKVTPLDRRRSLVTSAVLLALLTLFAGCRFHNVNEDPEPEVARRSQFYRKSNEIEAKRYKDKWWLEFEDEQLNKLVDEALKHNLDVRVAWARLRQTREVLDQATAGLFPEISVAGNITRNRSVFGQGAFGNQIFLSTQYSLNANASYELDIWGRVYSEREAAKKELETSQFDLEATYLTLTGNIAETWFQICEAQSQISLLEQQLTTNKQLAQFLKQRYDRAAIEFLDVLQQRQQVASIEAQLPTLKRNLGILQHQLALLLGRTPGEIVKDRHTLPELPPTPEVGVPSALLQRRPDIRAAKNQLVAADHRINSAIANRLPSIVLNGRIGYSSFELDTLFDEFVGSLGAALTGPVFDAGRRASEVDRQRAVVLELTQTYARTTLNAIKEVEDALHNEREQRNYLTKLQAQYDLSQQTLNRAQKQYEAGISDYINVLNSLQSNQTLERTLITAKRDLLLYRARLYRALGGSWMKTLKDPFLKEQTS